jgi:HlyD family secretion protein
MKKAKGILTYILNHKKFAAVILLLVLIAGYLLFPKNNTNSITTQEVHKGKIVQSINATGNIDSESKVNLSFLSSGKLTYIGVKEGDTITSGQTIATLDQRSLRTSLEQTLIDYSKQRNTFDTTSDANLHHTPKDSLNDAMRRILENNQNDLNKAVNSVELQQLVLEQSVLSSPIDGVVIRADAETAGVTVSTQTLYTIADPKHLVFNIDVDEADIGKVKIGQPLNLTLDAYPDSILSLKVMEIDFASHKSDTGGTVYTVKGSMPENNDNKYRIGMNGDAEIILSEKQNTLLIPISSLIDSNHVYVSIDHTFNKRTIKTGLQSDTEVEVLSGLKIGEKVALIPEDVSKVIQSSK